jgi:uncharacterized membrane protein YfcA
MAFLALGVVVGLLSGVLGLGGGIFLVPALIFLFDFSPHEAQGTSLAVLIPPIGLFAALEYYRKGYVDFSVVGFICLGFLFGAYGGAFFVDRIPVRTMRSIFGLFMLFIALQMVFTHPDRRFGSVVPAALVTAFVAALRALERRLGIGMPRTRRYLERHKPRGPQIEYHI